MSRILMVFADPGVGILAEPPDWAKSVPETPSSEWPWAVDKVRYCVGPSEAAREGPVLATRERSLEAPELELVQTWDILAMLEDAFLVHVCRPYTRAGETAFLAAKALDKRIVLSDFEPRTSAIGTSFGLVDLADCIICTSEEAGTMSDHSPVQVADLSRDASLPRLNDIYRALASGQALPL